MVTLDRTIQGISYQNYSLDWQPSMKEFVPEMMDTGELILYWII
jgi:hypothetical protein